MSADNFLIILECPTRDGEREWRVFETSLSGFNERPWKRGAGDALTVELYKTFLYEPIHSSEEAAEAFCDSVERNKIVEYETAYYKLKYPFPTLQEHDAAYQRWLAAAPERDWVLERQWVRGQLASMRLQLTTRHTLLKRLRGVLTDQQERENLRWLTQEIRDCKRLITFCNQQIVQVLAKRLALTANPPTGVTKVS